MATSSTEPDFPSADARAPIIPVAAHVRNAHPAAGGVRMLRRGYNFVDGSDAVRRLKAGLFFLAYQNDMRTDFMPIQPR